MTLPVFAYPDQHRWGIPDYANRLAGRILEDLEHDDLMDAERLREWRRASRDGWISDTQGRW